MHAQPTPTRFRISEHVRWSDIDLAGIICYGAYVRFFEIAETELFRAAGFPYAELFERFDFWLPRAQLHFDFRRPARLDDRLDVDMWVAHIGTSSLRLGFEVRKSGPPYDPQDPGDDRRARGEITAEGHAVLVAVARTSLKPMPLPPEVRAALAPFTALPAAGGFATMMQDSRK